MKIRLGVAVLLWVSIGQAASALQVKAPPPWSMSDEQRIAERTNRVKAAERVRQSAERQAATANRNQEVRANGKAMNGDIIVGRVHPELFFPDELFRIMARAAFADDVRGRASYREALSADVARIGLPPDFWATLESILDDHLSVSRQVRALHKSAAASADPATATRARREAQAIQHGQCAVLAKSLERARVTFGRTVFDQFLYEAVAPGAVINLERPYTAAEIHDIRKDCK